MKDTIFYDLCARLVGAAMLYYAVDNSKGWLAVVGVILLCGVVSFIWKEDGK